jgi:hypothetical protein
LNESTAVDDLTESIRHYRSVLQQLDEKFPQPFVLQSVLDADAKARGVQVGKTPEAPAAETKDATKPEEATPSDEPAASSDEPVKP